MEPVSAVGLSASLISCVKIITSSINSLLALQTKFRQADLTVQLLLGQLSTLRAALNEICQWINVSLIDVPQHEQLALDLTTSIEGCNVLLLILSDRIALLDRDGAHQDGVESLSVRGKMRLLWAEKESNQYLSHLNNQINALNLLLTALQCRSVHDQNVLLQNRESRYIMHLVKDDTSSLLWLKDADSYLSRQSIMSDVSSMSDVNFEFDREIFSSKAYQVAMRSALAGKKGKMPQRQRAPLSDAIRAIRYGCSDDTEDDAQTIGSKTLDHQPLNDVNSNEIIKKSKHADAATFFAQEKKGKMPQRQSSFSNKARKVIEHESSKDSKDDERKVRREHVDSLQLYDGIANGIIKKSNQANCADLVTLESKDKKPQRPRLPFNDATNTLGFEFFNDSEDDAQTIRDVSGNPRSLNDATKLYSDKRIDHLEGDPQPTCILKSIEFFQDSSSICPEVVNMRGERSNKDDPRTDKRGPRSIKYLAKIRTLARMKEALFKLSLPPSFLTTIEKGHKPLSSNDIDSNSRSPPSSVAFQHLRENSKVLLLGSSGAGKSTLLKSMTICHEGTLCSLDERRGYIEIIYSNLILDLREILDAMEMFKIPIDSQDKEYHVRTIFMVTIPLHEISEEITLAIKILWDDSGVQTCVRKSDSCQLIDPFGYFFDNFRRIASSTYIPTDQDILRLQIRTTGITKKHFTAKGFAYNIYDVGGTRSERKKWIRCFENTDIILFLVDISAYDRCLYEDSTVSMMQEDFVLFDSICNSRWFLKTSIVLLFTHVDLLQRKLAISPITDYLAGFEGDTLSVEAAKAYFMVRFLDLNQSPDKEVQVGFTDMSDDTSSGKAAFAALETCVKLQGGRTQDTT